MKKIETHYKYKHYGNLLLNVIEKSKKNHCKEFFKNDMNNIKNTWKGIRNLILWEQSTLPNIHLSY